MMVGADVTVSAGTVITVAAVKEANARALTRSLRTYADPILGSPRSAFSALTSGDGVTSRVQRPSGSGSAPCRPRRRRSGVNRHSSSRPVGTGKSAGSYDWCSCSLETGASDSSAP